VTFTPIDRRIVYMARQRPTDGLQREVYAQPLSTMPQLEQFGWTCTRSATQLSLAEHHHRGLFEICLLVGGHVSWWAGGQIHALGPGDLYFTKPDEPHGGVDNVLQPCSLYWLQVSLRADQPLPGLDARATRRISRALKRLSHRKFPASDPLCQAFYTIHTELRDRPPFWEMAVHAAAKSLLVQMLRDHDQAQQAGQATGRPSAPVAGAIERMRSDLSHAVSVEQLAAEAGLGVSRFHERFVKEVGFSPAAYRMHLRIRSAKQLLRSRSTSVTHLANELGFSSSQHFATAFRRLVGMSPSAYRQRMQP
jgi:AraC-like DNA-binding protein